MEDLEKIGISGDLFKDVLAEYKRQGKSIQQMQHDLIEYQILIDKRKSSTIALKSVENDT